MNKKETIKNLRKYLEGKSGVDVRLNITEAVMFIESITLTESEKSILREILINEKVRYKGLSEKYKDDKYYDIFMSLMSKLESGIL